VLPARNLRKDWIFRGDLLLKVQKKRQNIQAELIVELKKKGAWRKGKLIAYNSGITHNITHIERFLKRESWWWSDSECWGKNV
jgi:hypothetical protein